MFNGNTIVGYVVHLIYFPKCRSNSEDAEVLKKSNECETSNSVLCTSSRLLSYAYTVLRILDRNVIFSELKRKVAESEAKRTELKRKSMSFEKFFDVCRPKAACVSAPSSTTE